MGFSDACLFVQVLGFSFQRSAIAWGGFCGGHLVGDVLVPSLLSNVDDARTLGTEISRSCVEYAEPVWVRP